MDAPIRATGSRKNLTRHAYYDLIADLLQLSEVQALRNYRHHITTTRFQHSLNVSYYNYLVCRFLRLDEASAARAGLLHDLYHYDTGRFSRKKPPIRHTKYHPMVALETAERLVPMNLREKDMIAKHMWPMTLQLPKYAESYILTFVDKYCALIEFLLPQPRILRNWLRKKCGAMA